MVTVLSGALGQQRATVPAMTRGPLFCCYCCYRRLLSLSLSLVLTLTVHPTSLTSLTFYDCPQSSNHRPSSFHIDIQSQRERVRERRESKAGKARAKVESRLVTSRITLDRVESLPVQSTRTMPMDCIYQLDHVTGFFSSPLTFRSLSPFIFNPTPFFSPLFASFSLSWSICLSLLSLSIYCLRSVYKVYVTQRHTRL